MRKLSLLVVIFLFCLLFLSGCKKNSLGINDDYFEKKQRFSVVADCKQNDAGYKMKIEKNGNQIKFTYISGEYANGLSFLFDAETESVSYYGLEIAKDNETLFKATTPAAISKAIQDYVSKPGENVEGMTEYGKYSATIDRASGLPKALNLPNHKFNCTFE